jgi:hypothetical protein
MQLFCHNMQQALPHPGERVGGVHARDKSRARRGTCQRESPTPRPAGGDVSLLLSMQVRVVVPGEEGYDFAHKVLDVTHLARPF